MYTIPLRRSWTLRSSWPVLSVLEASVKDLGYFNESKIHVHLYFYLAGQYLDILAVSCDSFDSDTNARIGRQNGRKNHLDTLQAVRQLCSQYKVRPEFFLLVDLRTLLL